MMMIFTTKAVAKILKEIDDYSYLLHICANINT